MKILFYDLETTGTMYWKNGIHQISGAIVIDGEIKEAFDFNVRPHEKAIIDPKALEVAGVTEEQIMKYPTMNEVHSKLLQILDKYCQKYDKSDKFHLAGYNIGHFDNSFLRAFFVQNGDNYFGSWFWPDYFDVYVMASLHFASTRHMFENFQQKTVAKALGIVFDESRLHDAAYDIFVCMEIFKALRK